MSVTVSIFAKTGGLEANSLEGSTSTDKTNYRGLVSSVIRPKKRLMTRQVCFPWNQTKCMINTANKPTGKDEQLPPTLFSLRITRTRPRRGNQGKCSQMYAERTWWHSFELALTSTPEGYSNECARDRGDAGRNIKIRKPVCGLKRPKFPFQLDLQRGKTFWAFSKMYTSSSLICLHLFSSPDSPTDQTELEL